MPQLPNRLSSSATGAAWLNQLRDYVASLTPRSSPTNRVHHTSQGVILESIPVKSVGGTATEGAGLNWRGMWDAAPSAPYMTGDEVMMGDGSAAGLYVSLIDNNPNAPDMGIGWAQISSFCTWL